MNIDLIHLLGNIKIRCIEYLHMVIRASSSNMTAIFFFFLPVANVL